MADNKNLAKANKEKNDEFYTQLEDIENELKYYKEHFKNKIVLCNCDDPFESNFFKYFALNFNSLGLKKLICTCYKGSPIITTQLSLFDVEGLVIKKEDSKKPYKIEITEVLDTNGDGAVDLTDIEYLIKNKKNTLTLLKGDGDFRSDECIELLKEADIVVTNPPFSLFREYLAQLMEYKKKFLIVGNINCITYKEVFPLVQHNKIWFGYCFNKTLTFRMSDNYVVNSNGFINSLGQKFGKVPGICWFTNLDITKRNEKIILYKKYNSEEYPRYVNYDAIEVGKVSDIPVDYNDKMGVPLTFLDKYNPRQFEIIGFSMDLAANMKDIANKGEYMQGGRRFYIKEKNGDYLYKRLYDRIVILKVNEEEIENGN